MSPTLRQSSFAESGPGRNWAHVIGPSAGIFFLMLGGEMTDLTLISIAPQTVRELLRSCSGAFLDFLRLKHYWLQRYLQMHTWSRSTTH